jgi:hypothetical protein
MIPWQLHCILAQERIADLYRVAERSRRATVFAIERRNASLSNPIARLRARLARVTTRRSASAP